MNDADLLASLADVQKIDYREPKKKAVKKKAKPTGLGPRIEPDEGITWEQLVELTKDDEWSEP